MPELALALAALLILPALGARPSAAATITVTNLADNLTTDGQVTLREAIVAANTDTSVDGSTPGSGPDEIVFATGPGTITLGGTQLPTVTGTLTITGLGANRLAIDGAQQSRVLEVVSGVTAAVSGVTISNGREAGVVGSGGGIFSGGTLTIANCRFLANAVAANGGGVLNEGGSLTVTNSFFSGNTAQNGGAIYSGNSLQVSDSTFDGNSTGGIAPFSGGGGALLVGGAATISGTTLSNNLAGNGGAVASLSGGTVTLTNSTVSGNQAINNGGGISNLGTLALQACTVTGNRANSNDDGIGDGGGIRNTTGSVVMQGTIVAGNHSTSGARSDIVGAVQASSSYNLIGVDTGLTGISHGTGGNQIGTAAAPLDPLLGPLQSNGGPTSTHALLAGGPALDRGSVGTCPGFDQRGLLRPLDGDHDMVAVCDIGAYEAFIVGSQPISFHTVTPCRLADTRLAPGPSGGPALAANTTRSFPAAGLCGVPADAVAVAINVAVVNQTDLGHLRLYPAGSAAPLVSTINFTPLKVRANNAVVPLGAAGQIAVRCVMAAPDATTHFVLDVSGYFR